MMDMIETRNANQENLAVIEGCLTKDPDVCDKIYSQFNRKIFNTAYRILGEESSAEDALQETMLNVYRGISRFRGDAKISTWISRITINVCLGMLRKGKKSRFVELDDLSSERLPAKVTTFSDPLEYASREELKSHIHDTLRKMTTKQAEVVRLHDMEGHTIEEIANITGCPVGTVKSRLFYGRQEFKALFKSLRYGKVADPSVSVH